MKRGETSAVTNDPMCGMALVSKRPPDSNPSQTHHLLGPRSPNPFLVAVETICPCCHGDLLGPVAVWIVWVAVGVEKACGAGGEPLHPTMRRPMVQPQRMFSEAGPVENDYHSWQWSVEHVVVKSL